MRHHCFLPLCLLLFANPLAAKAEVLVDFQNFVIDAGQTAIVDVLIRSDDLVIGDDIGFYDLEFTITADAGNLPGTQLRFSPSPSTAYAALGNLTNPNDYVFGGAAMGDPFASVSNGVTPNQVLSVTDFTDDPLPSNVNVTTNQSFGQFSIQHILPVGADPAFAADDQYTISVSGILEDVDFNSVAFQLANPVITVRSVAIPEPSSLALMIGIAVIAVRRKRKRVQPEQSSTLVCWKNPGELSCFP